MTFTATQMIVAVLQDMYPKARDSWIRRAAEDSVEWAIKNPNPSQAEIEIQEKRTTKMCTTGRWYS
jgi:hypothetical protein